MISILTTKGNSIRNMSKKVQLAQPAENKNRKNKITENILNTPSAVYYSKFPNSSIYPLKHFIYITDNSEVFK